MSPDLKLSSPNTTKIEPATPTALEHDGRFVFGVFKGCGP